MVYTGHVVAWYEQNDGRTKEVFFPVGQIRHEQLECLGEDKALFRAEGQFRNANNKGLQSAIRKERNG